MAVTDEQVTTLHALLAGEFATFDQMNARLAQSEDWTGYNVLIAAAFFKAANRRFLKADDRKNEVTEFVASARTRSDDAADQLDPRTAERLLLAIFSDDDDLRDLTSQSRFGTQFLLLAALVADEGWDEEELGRFMIEARTLADKWTS